jgi:hypothetical protein
MFEGGLITDMPGMCAHFRLLRLSILDKVFLNGFLLPVKWVLCYYGYTIIHAQLHGFFHNFLLVDDDLLTPNYYRQYLIRQ